MKNFIFEMLLARLNWPDMLVREQTLHAIKDFLIINQSFKKDFLVFLEQQNIESKVLEILAIIYLINQEQTDYFVLNEIESKIKAPSILSDLCLEEIFQIKLLEQKRLWQKNYTIDIPYDLKIEDTNYKINGLVKRNLDLLKKRCNMNLNFEDQFYLECKQIFSQNDCSHYGRVDHFCEPRYAGFPNIKLLQDDIQISGFLRLISFCVDVYNLPIDFALVLSKDFFPIDLGLLELRSTYKPLFIDQLLNYSFEKWDFQENDFIPVYLSCPLKEETDASLNKEIIALDVFPVHLNHSPKSLAYYFDFFRRGELLKTIEQIPWHINIKKIIIPQDIPEHFIGLFHNCYNYIQQLYALHRDLFIPNEKELKIDIKNDKLIFKVNQQVIGYLQYWYDNYNTFSYKNTTVCSGIITYFHKDYLNKINVNNDVTLLINYKKFRTNTHGAFEQADNLYYSIKFSN